MQALVGARIREARDQLGLSQTEFGALVGAASRTVQTWEAGVVLPRPETFQRVAEKTGRPMRWFYQDEVAA